MSPEASDHHENELYDIPDMEGKDKTVVGLLAAN
jgi:hypothetical protein